MLVLHVFLHVFLISEFIIEFDVQSATCMIIVHMINVDIVDVDTYMNLSS